MEDYNSRHTGPVIDDAVDRAKDGGALDQSLAKKPNPNLLDNWYFGNPVNQRGVTAFAADSYGIDRWKSFYSGVSVSSGGLTMANGSQVVEQRLEGTFVCGKKCTMSVLLADGTLHSGTVVFADEATVCSFFLDDICTAYSYLNEDNIALIAIRSYAAMTIVAAKLELGSAQTLAHQDEEGNWVLNEIPNYAEELMKCQRYYQNITCFGVLVPTGESILPGFLFPVTMRTTPAVVLKDKDGTEGCVEFWTNSGLAQGNTVKQIVAQTDSIRYLVLETATTAQTRVFYRGYMSADL